MTLKRLILPQLKGSVSHRIQNTYYNASRVCLPIRPCLSKTPKWHNCLYNLQEVEHVCPPVRFKCFWAAHGQCILRAVAIPPLLLLGDLSDLSVPLSFYEKCHIHSLCSPAASEVPTSRRSLPWAVQLKSFHLLTIISLTITKPKSSFSC